MFIKKYILSFLALTVSMVQAMPTKAELAQDTIEAKLPIRPILKIVEKDSDTNIIGTADSNSNVFTSTNSTEDIIKPNSDYKNYKVGAIDETAQVNPNGSASVNINIDLPQSPYLFQPQLSLAYNSMNMAGNMGWGWNLSGISCISKTNHNFYFDGDVKSASATNNFDGTFTLDGIRLIKTSSSSSTIFYESVKGKILVKAILNSGNISYFEVKYPNGNVGYFRYRQNNDYYLSEIKDPRNQYVYYNYTTTTQGLLLTDINYAHGQYHVKFYYTTRQEPSGTVFKQGERYAYTYLLTNIEISINSNIWKKYNIEYETKNDSHFVTSIGCSDSEGNALPPLIFKYGTKNNNRNFKFLNGQLTKYFPFEKTTDIIAQKGKFQYGIVNDGIVFYPNYLSNIEIWRHKTMLRHSQNYFTNQYSDTQEIVVANGLEDNLTFDCGKLTTGKGFNGIICADIDQAPGDEIIKFNEYLDGENDQTEITAYSPNIYGGLTQKYKFLHSFNNQHKDSDGKTSVLPKNFYVGDFNGNGTNEILAIMPSNLLDSGNSTQLYLIDITSGKVLYQNEAPFTYNQLFCKYNSDGDLIMDANDAVQNSDRLFILDIDGDGKSEIVHIAEDGTSTYAFEWENENATGCKKIYFDSTLKKEYTISHKIYLAQLNSDNLPDFIITPNENSSNWNAYLSMGNGKFYKQTVSYPYSYSSSKNYFFQDINFDGKSDLVEYQDDGKYIRACLTNNKFSQAEIITSDIEENAILIPSNVSSRDWMSSLISFNNKGAIKKFLFQGNDFNAKLLTGYTNSFGIAKLFSYQNLYNSEYIAGNGAQFPFVNYKGALLVVKDYKIKTPQKTLSDIHYRYQNALVHKQGLGFKGYEYVYSYNNVSGTSTRTQFDVFHDCGILQTDDVNTTVSNEYAFDIKPNMIDNSVLTKTTTIDKATNTTKTEDFVYDSYQNIIGKNTTWGNEYSVNDRYKFNNINDGNQYILGQLISEEHVVNRNGNTELTSSDYVYTNNLLKEKKCYTNGYLVNTEDYEYNSYGQKTTVSLTSFNSPIKHVTTFEYNGNGLISCKTGQDGLTQTFEYDNFDRLQSSHDYKGNSNYKYDTFGTLLNTTKNDGTICTNHIAWSEGEAGSIYKIESTETGKPKSVKFYDELGHLVRVGSCHYDGSFQYIDKEYDEKGNMITLSEPFKQSYSSNKYRYNYDIYGRVTSIESPWGNTTTYSYDGLSVTTAENNKTSKKTFRVLL